MVIKRFTWRRPSVRLIAFFWFLFVVLPPLAASSVLMLIDMLRKRNHLQGYFTSLRDKPPVFVGDSEIQFYTYGQDLFEAMLYEISRAEEYVMLESYIWKGDQIGCRFKEALLRAADRGVEVYAVFDDFANLVVPRAFKEFPLSIHLYRHPIFSWPWNPFRISSYARDHRKILIVDSRVAFIGGYNIGDTYATEWRDTHARISGPGALEVENAFIDFWNFHRGRWRPAIPDRLKREWDPHLNVHRNDPPTLIFPIRSTYIESIDRALHHVYLTQAYFIPDHIFIQTLVDAARRGADVRVLLPAKSNHIVADWLARGIYERCLQGGVRLFLYQDAMVHAKTATIDGAWSTVGSANLDRLSLLGNYEVNVEFYDPDTAHQMELIFEQDLQHAHELTSDEWNRRPYIWKFLERALVCLRPFF